MAIPPHLQDFWNAFVAATDGAKEARFYEAFHFGDDEALANDLAALVLQGTKRATTGSVWSFEAEGKRIPEAGDLSVVTSWSGEPLCVIETETVEIVPFNEVSAEFAAIEGEGDGSLSFWQQGHRRYFTRECARAGRQFSESMLVACECFKVIYRPMAQQPAEPSSDPARRYVYVWEFEVAPERMQAFLAAYGPSGAWSQLFQRASGYVETLLLQDQSVPGRFLTVDRWSSESAHDAFLAEFRAEYEALDRACEALTRHESSLGSYWELVHQVV